VELGVVYFAGLGFGAEHTNLVAVHWFVMDECE
jgi:hypothetical protein